MKQYWLLIIPLLCLLFGMTYTTLFLKKNQTEHFSLQENKYVVGYIKSPLLERKSYRTILSVEAVVDSQQIYIIVVEIYYSYLAKDSSITH
ncbi:MAG: hypothetical protein R2801_10960 [Chitinophagales bacterium]